MSEKLLDKIKELENKRNLIMEQEVEKLLGGAPDESQQSSLDWLEKSSTLLEYKKNITNGTRKKRLIVALSLLLLCTLIAGGLWAISLSSVNVSMKIVSGNVGFTLSANWSLPEAFICDYLRIENFQALHAPELEINFENQSGSAQVEVSGKDIVIESLALQKNGIIEFDSHSNLLSISVKQSTVVGAFAVKTIYSLTAKGIKDAEVKEKDFQYPETIEFKGFGEGRAPINIIFKIKRTENNYPWKAEGMRTNRIHFLREVQGGAPLFISTVKRGLVKLYDVPGEEKVYHRDVVKMDHIQLRRLEIACSDALHELHIFAEGKVKNLKVGPEGFERNPAPSWLEYIYLNQRFMFFLGAVVSLLTSLWGIKETIFK